MILVHVVFVEATIFNPTDLCIISSNARLRELHLVLHLFIEISLRYSQLSESLTAVSI